MALTRVLKETMLARVQADSIFRDAMHNEDIEIELFFKSLNRMCGPIGNPQARNLFNIIRQLQRHAGLKLRITVQHSQKAATSPC